MDSDKCLKKNKILLNKYKKLSYQIHKSISIFTSKCKKLITDLALTHIQASVQLRDAHQRNTEGKLRELEDIANVNQVA